MANKNCVRSPGEKSLQRICVGKCLLSIGDDVVFEVMVGEEDDCVHGPIAGIFIKEGTFYMFVCCYEHYCDG